MVDLCQHCRLRRRSISTRSGEQQVPDKANPCETDNRKSTSGSIESNNRGRWFLQLSNGFYRGLVDSEHLHQRELRLVVEGFRVRHRQRDGAEQIPVLSEV